MSAVLSSLEAPPAVAGRLRGFRSGASEIDDAALRCEGQLPDWLRGSLLLNGPALWELPGGSLDHWFDGYAMLHRLRLGDGAPRYRSRFVRSDAYRRSLAAGRPVYGEFGSANPSSMLQRLKGVGGTDNPAVVMSRLGGQWLAVSETPHLTFFDPDTLQTGARLDLDTDLRLHLMAAHGFTLDDGSYLNLGIRLGPTCEMTLFRVDPLSRRPHVLNRLRVPKTGYLHAFALAPGHAIVWNCSMRAQPLSFRFSGKAYKDNFRWEPEAGATLHAIPLDGGVVRTWRIPPMFAFHATQAWAEGPDLLLEISIYDDASVFDDLMLAARREGRAARSLPRLVRYRLRPDADEAFPEPLHVALELQQVHPARIGRARARVCWGAGAGAQGELLDRTLRVDLDAEDVTTWQRGGAVQLEPLFVPRPGGDADDDGVLLVPTLADDDAATVIGVLDAHDLRCLALIHAPQVVPFGFHAAFAAAG